MKAMTSRSVSIATAAERSSRIVCWKDRRISTTRSALLSRIRLCSAFSSVSCNITTTMSSRIEVRALVGPRPVYSWTIRTTAREIEASRGPSVWCCSSGAIGTGFRTPQNRWAAREVEGVHEDPDARHPPRLAVRSAGGEVLDRELDRRGPARHLLESRACRARRWELA